MRSVRGLFRSMSNQAFHFELVSRREITDGRAMRRLLALPELRVCGTEAQFQEWPDCSMMLYLLGSLSRIFGISLAPKCAAVVVGIGCECHVPDERCDRYHAGEHNEGCSAFKPLECVLACCWMPALCIHASAESMWQGLRCRDPATLHQKSKQAQLMQNDLGTLVDSPRYTLWQRCAFVMGHVCHSCGRGNSAISDT